MLALFLFFSFLPSLISALQQQTSSQDDKILSLPGATFEIKFNQYSGYLNVGNEKKYHYWLVESQKDPQKDPLLLWLNGGPGGSSLVGLLGENGPFRVDWEGKAIEENVYSWNKVANVVYLESPAGVGFSYEPEKTNYSDSLVAKENHLALVAFAAKFPNFKNRKFFISGESYAGVYIPTLSVEILKDKNFPFDFQGVAIGNGWYDDNLLGNTAVDYVFYRGTFAVELLHDLRKECNCSEYFCDYFSNFNLKDRPLNNCTQLLKLLSSTTNGLFGFNIYESCYENPKNSSPKISHYMPKEYIARIDKLAIVIEPNYCNLSYIMGIPMQIYLNDAQVRKALHIPDYVQAWKIAGSLENYDDDLLNNTMLPQFATMLKSGISILVYHGDFDLVCNFLEGQQFLRSEKLGLKLIGRRQPWKYSDDVFPIAGFWDKFEQNVDFLTVMGAGHFVPADKPREALQMIGNFILGTRNYSKPVLAG